MDKQVSRQFFNNEAAHWDETIRSNDADKLQAMAARLSIPKNARVLDVGTGTGVFVPYILSKLNGNGMITCIDFAFQMLEIALNKNGDDGINYVCAEIENLGLIRDKFDVVICFSTFPHFHDKPLALENIFEALTEGGTVYICHSASRGSINDIHRKILDFSDHLIPEKKEMHGLLDKSGFSNISIAEDEVFYLVKAIKPF